jgi:hypothetical protein
MMFLPVVLSQRVAVGREDAAALIIVNLYDETVMNFVS